MASHLSALLWMQNVEEVRRPCVYFMTSSVRISSNRQIDVHSPRKFFCLLIVETHMIVESVCVYGYLYFVGTCHIVFMCVPGSARLIRSRVCSVPQGLAA